MTLSIMIVWKTHLKTQ